MSYFLSGFIKRASEDSQVLINNPYMKLKIRKRLKEDASDLKRSFLRGATIGGVGGLAAGGLNYAMGDKKPGRLWKAVKATGRIGIPSAALAGLLHASHTYGKIRQRNKMEEELHKLRELPEFGGSSET